MNTKTRAAGVVCMAISLLTGLSTFNGRAGWVCDGSGATIDSDPEAPININGSNDWMVWHAALWGSGGSSVTGPSVTWSASIHAEAWTYSSDWWDGWYHYGHTSAVSGNIYADYIGAHWETVPEEDPPSGEEVQVSMNADFYGSVRTLSYWWADWLGTDSTDPGNPDSSDVTWAIVGAGAQVYGSGGSGGGGASTQGGSTNGIPGGSGPGGSNHCDGTASMNVAVPSSGFDAASGSEGASFQSEVDFTFSYSDTYTTSGDPDGIYLGSPNLSAFASADFNLLSSRASDWERMGAYAEAFADISGGITYSVGN